MRNKSIAFYLTSERIVFFSIVLVSVTFSAFAFNGPPVGCTPGSCVTPLVVNYATQTVSVGTVPTEDLHVANKAYVDDVVSSGGIPSGMVAMFKDDCPTGWTRFDDLDGRVPKGNDVYGATGGSDTHSHSYSSTNVTYLNYMRNYGLTGINSASSWPPYLEVIWCEKD